MPSLITEILSDRSNGLPRIIKYIEENPNIDVSQPDSSNGFYPIEIATMFGSVATVKFLLTKKPLPLDAKDFRANLIDRALVNDSAMVTCLTDSELRLWEEFHDGTTDLHVACARGDDDFVKSILTANPLRLSETNNKGRGLLYYAAAAGHSELANYLMEEKAILKNEESPALTAKEKFKIAVYLFASGCFYIIRQPSTAFDYFQRSIHNFEKCEYLLGSVPMEQKALYWRAKSKARISCALIFFRMGSAKATFDPLVAQSYKNSIMEYEDALMCLNNIPTAGQTPADVNEKINTLRALANAYVAHSQACVSSVKSKNLVADYKTSIQSYEKAVKYIESIPMPQRTVEDKNIQLGAQKPEHIFNKLAHDFNNMGKIYVEYTEYDKAVDAFSNAINTLFEAITSLESTPKKSPADLLAIDVFQNRLGEIYRQLSDAYYHLIFQFESAGNVESAVQACKASIEFLEQSIAMLEMFAESNPEIYELDLINMRKDLSQTYYKLSTFNKMQGYYIEEQANQAKATSLLASVPPQNLSILDQKTLEEWSLLPPSQAMVQTVTPEKTLAELQRDMQILKLENAFLHKTVEEFKAKVKIFQPVELNSGNRPPLNPLNLMKPASFSFLRSSNRQQSGGNQPADETKQESNSAKL